MEHGDYGNLFSKPATANIDITKTTADNTAEEKITADIEEPDTQATHPITQILDLAVNAAVPICQHNGLRPPEKDTYDAFTRDVVNQAAWEYLPNAEGDGDTPRWLILIIAIVGLILVFMPTASSLIEKRREQIEAQTPEPEPETYNTQTEELETYHPADETPHTAEATIPLTISAIPAL